MNMFRQYQMLMEPNQELNNPMTPAYLAGLRSQIGDLYRPDPFIYVYDKVLTASQTNVQDQLTISSDADFMLMGLSVPTSTGLFSLQLSDARLYYLSNTPLLSTLFSTDPTLPFPFIGDYDTDTETGGLWIPSGSRIGITLNDLSAGTNTIQLNFVGVKKLKVA